MGIRPTVALWHTARTGAIGHQLPFATPQKLTFERLQYSVTCRWVESHYSAIAAVRLLGYGGLLTI